MTFFSPPVQGTFLGGLHYHCLCLVLFFCTLVSNLHWYCLVFFFVHKIASETNIPHTQMVNNSNSGPVVSTLLATVVNSRDNL